MLLSERRKDISRMNEIARILIKYGFANIVHKINIVDELHIASKYRKYRGIPEDPNVRVRLALEELGTTFIKLGQTLSTYPNIVGYDLAEEFINYVMNKQLSHKIIVEGVQISLSLNDKDNIINYKQLKTYPIIFKGTAGITSTIRALKRDKKKRTMYKIAHKYSLLNT